VFHYPLYSAAATPEIGDRYLTTPPDGSESIERLLARNDVKLVLNGHAHIYQRNNPHYGMVSIISGGGGATPVPVGSDTKSGCAQVYKDTRRGIVAYARGWDAFGGSACNTSRPATRSNVHHYLLVTLETNTATVQAVDSTGAIFDTATLR
jgi:hypothetical protein